MFSERLQQPIYKVPAQNSAADITYTQNGEGDLVVLVHGSLCDLRYWRWQLKMLSSSCQVVSLSLPGCWPNDSNLSAYEFSFDLHVAALTELIDALRQPHQKIYVLGHSRGAQVAINYICQSTTKPIDGLILADPAFIIGQAHSPLPVIKDAAEQLLKGNDEQGLAMFIDAVSGPNTWRQMVGWFKTMVQDNAYTLIEQSRETLPTVTQADLKHVTHTPTLLINGANSPERYQNSTQMLLQHLSHTYHTVIAQASHGMNLAKPKAFNQALLDFIKR